MRSYAAQTRPLMKVMIDDGEAPPTAKLNFALQTFCRFLQLAIKMKYAYRKIFLASMLDRLEEDKKRGLSGFTREEGQVGGWTLRRHSA